jgi:aminoglycoside 6'-N-acetyltransferase I
MVESNHRRQGVGRALVKAAEQWATEQGFREIASDTQLENIGSIAAHLHLGYTEVERNVCFFKKI